MPSFALARTRFGGFGGGRSGPPPATSCALLLVRSERTDEGDNIVDVTGGQLLHRLHFALALFDDGTDFGIAQSLNLLGGQRPNVRFEHPRKRRVPLALGAVAHLAMFLISDFARLGISRGGGCGRRCQS